MYKGVYYKLTHDTTNCADNVLSALLQLMQFILPKTQVDGGGYC